MDQQQPGPSRHSSLSCDVCQQGFTNQQNLVRHQTTVHTERSCHCPQCERTFNCQDNFHRHVQKCRKRRQDQCDNETPPAKQRRESHDCEDCGRRFEQALSPEQHRVQIHQPRWCTTCGEQFLGTRALTAHRRSDHPKPFECGQCGRTFARLNNHMSHQTAKQGAAPRQSGGGAAAAPVDEPPNWRAMADPTQYTSLPKEECSPLPYTNKNGHKSAHSFIATTIFTIGATFVCAIYNQLRWQPI
ncbi:gastrula zinc finger protein XlCGF7.1-like [Montipora foliosa]|uniref:gastrula zinc finger protein XlCGF7.1-like n=1 Tax=Montipora foliosa TaxID=591990 RepID=UPI0035F127AE